MMYARGMLQMIALAVTALAMAWPTSAATLFEDLFTTTITPGTIWQAYGSGLPDDWGVVSVSDEDGFSLRFNSVAGTAEEVTGFETISPISLDGLLGGVRVEARVAPLNQTVAGDGGASTAAVALKVTGSTGAYTQLASSANRLTPPDWADVYEDNEGSQDFEVAFAHFDQEDGNDDPAVNFRTLILDILPDGTRFTVLNTNLTVNSRIGGFNPNLTLADFGFEVTIALLQKRSDQTLSAPEPTVGDVNRVTVSSITPVLPLLDLIVNKATGEMSLNAGFLATPLNSYNITSEAGALDPAGWNAGNFASQATGGLSADLDGDGDVDGADFLEGQRQGLGANFFADFENQFGQSGSSPGAQWEVLNDTQNQLFEAFLNGISTIAADSGQSIGNGYNTTNGAEDLIFTYTRDGEEFDGIVSYINGSLATGAFVPEPSALVLVMLTALFAFAPGWRKTSNDFRLNG